MKNLPAKRQTGYALIVVLFGIALCALMVIVLMDRGTVGIKSADSITQARRVRALSDMVQNIVQAQIHDATTLNQELDTPIDKRDTWASQPGAIRVYTGTGTLRQIYKLYSAEELTTESTNLAADVPNKWYESPHLYTDLNEPVAEIIVSSGTTSTVLHYPILNPAVRGTALLPGATGIKDGFSIKNAPVATGSTANAAPMPVRWIYVLQDGTRCQLGDERIHRDNNPIVGRIAFWTDDETAKVNINTASPTTSYSHWDVPRSFSRIEWETYAWGQPSQNEYYRYPGHPSTVSLRPILGTLGGLGNKEYFDLTSRFYWGGSESHEGNPNQFKSKYTSQPRTSLLTMKEDRAYTSVDELLFNSHPVGTGTTTARSVISQDQVNALHFFLSASSRAPELNLFGQPRVTIWPIFGDNDSPDPGPTRRTPYDRLIAYNSTLVGKEYYFTREQPLHPTHDYLNIRRNKEIYAYLQKMTETPVPGFPTTGTFRTKYGGDRDQILTEIFDYIRIVNLNETYAGRGETGTGEDYKSYTPDALKLLDKSDNYQIDSPSKGAGFVVPIRIGDDTRGAGRFPALTGAGLWFVRHWQVLAKGDTNPNPPQKLSAMLVFKTCTPMQGFMPWVGSKFQFELANADIQVQVSDGSPTTLFTSGTSREIYYAPHFIFQSSSGPGGFQGSAWVAGMNDGQLTSGDTPFFSVPIDIPENSSTFSILGGSIDVRLLVDGAVIQTYQFTFPEVVDLQLPTRDPRDVGPRNDWQFDNHTWWRARWYYGPFGPFPGDHFRGVELPHGDARLAIYAKTSESAPFSSFVKHPDYDDKTKAFAHSFRGYADGWPYLWFGGRGGYYVSDPGITYEINTTDLSFNNNGRNLKSDMRPEITPAVQSLTPQWSGDYDNGISRFSDGPFLNKPDEGALGHNASEAPYRNSLWSIGSGLFSPLRQVPSPVMFGSLPTGVKANIPWRTLLFNPNPADPGHIGFSDPKDYLLLDLFRMPVVEPYSISSPSTTDGKINMNYAIAPFSYIRRASSFYSLFESIKLFSVPNSSSKVFKFDKDFTNYRTTVDTTKTLEQFDARFANNDIFRSAAEICSLFIVPQGQTVAKMADLSDQGYWAGRKLTADNSRERPYVELYPKLTTQSNTYRLHMRVQALPPSDRAPANGEDFEPLAEYRGSRLIERYLNPNNPSLQAVDPDDSNLNELFQYRALEARQFNP